MYDELIGKYLNGYKIVRIEKDPFIKGQINLWTDEEKSNVFGDIHIVKFFIRDESNNAKIYQELVDKEKYELQQRIDKAINKIEDLRMEKWSITGTDIIDILDILKEVE